MLLGMAHMRETIVLPTNTCQCSEEFTVVTRIFSAIFSSALKAFFVIGNLLKRHVDDIHTLIQVQRKVVAGSVAVVATVVIFAEFDFRGVGLEEVQNTGDLPVIHFVGCHFVTPIIGSSIDMLAVVGMLATATTSATRFARIDAHDLLMGDGENVVVHI